MLQGRKIERNEVMIERGLLLCWDLLFNLLRLILSLSSLWKYYMRKTLKMMPSSCVLKLGNEKHYWLLRIVEWLRNWPLFIDIFPQIVCLCHNIAPSCLQISSTDFRTSARHLLKTAKENLQRCQQEMEYSVNESLATLERKLQTV